MTQSLFNLSGQVALVTGSSRGIGRAIVEAMAEHGARVVVSSRHLDACEAVATDLNHRYGPGTATAIEANLSSRPSLQTMVDRATASLGPITALVCNAATNPYFGPMAGITDEQFRKILENNIISNHWLIQMAIPGLVEAGGGSITIVSSIGGLKGSTTLGTYGISKAGDMQLARNLADELGPAGVRVNCIAPGLIRTDFARALWEDPATLARATSRAPLRRIGESFEIAGLAVFLAAKAGGFTTGQTIVVDGGVTSSGS